MSERERERGRVMCAGSTTQTHSKVKMEKVFNGFIMFTFICVTEWLHKPGTTRRSDQDAGRTTNTHTHTLTVALTITLTHSHTLSLSLTHAGSVCSTHSREISGSREVLPPALPSCPPSSGSARSPPALPACCLPSALASSETLTASDSAGFR